MSPFFNRAWAACLGALLVSAAVSAADAPPRVLASQGTPPVISKPVPKPPTSQSTPAKPVARTTTPARSTASKTTPAKAKNAKATKGGKPVPLQTVELDWRELLPPRQRALYSPNAPPPAHGYLGEGGPPAAQLQNFDVNLELTEIPVRLPGFVVPVGANANGIVREFFLVPYVGACIHVPPPPPNQMVYVKSKTGISLKSVHEAYWVTGKMRVEQTTTSLGASAYALDADKIEQYQY
jgi:hypothetical protein